MDTNVISSYLDDPNLLLSIISQASKENLKTYQEEFEQFTESPVGKSGTFNPITGETTTVREHRAQKIAAALKNIDELG